VNVSRPWRKHSEPDARAYSRRRRDVGPYAVAVTAAESPGRNWFLRAIEQADGGWTCSYGRIVYDRHDGLPDALDHLHEIAETMRPAELFIHRLDGTVENIGPA
jgi:hypothetical protein